jgi:hypothetical protein
MCQNRVFLWRSKVYINYYVLKNCILPQAPFKHLHIVMEVEQNIENQNINLEENLNLIHGTEENQSSLNMLLIKILNQKLLIGLVVCGLLVIFTLESINALDNSSSMKGISRSEILLKHLVKP